MSKWLTRCVQSERDKSVDLALCDDASCLSVDSPRYLVLSRSRVRRTDSAPVVPFLRSRIVASVRRVIASVHRVIAPFVERCATNVDIPVAIPGGFRPCCVQHTCLVSQLLSGIAVRFRSSYHGGHARASQSRSIRVRQASRLHKDCITTSCCRNRFDVSCSVMFVVAIIFFCSARQRYTSRHNNKSTIDHHAPLDDSTTTRLRLSICGYRFDSTKCFTSGVFPRGSNNSSSLGRSDALMIATRTSSQCRAIQQYPGYAMLMVLTVLSPLALLTSRTIYIHR